LQCSIGQRASEEAPAYPCGMSFICYVLMSFWWLSSWSSQFSVLSPQTPFPSSHIGESPRGQMTATQNRRPTDRLSADVLPSSCRRPASWDSAPGSGCGPLLLCVRACRLVFVIPDGMSSIKIYLSDFSWFTYIDLGYISAGTPISGSSKQINNFYDGPGMAQAQFLSWPSHPDWSFI